MLEPVSVEESVEEPAAPVSDEFVGGSIQPPTTVHFGRPPGTENRPAGVAALVAALSFVLSAAVPWAARVPRLGGTESYGWYDANGAFGVGWLALLLAAVAFGLAAAALAGRVDRRLRLADTVVGAVAVGFGAVEALRIQAAVSSVEQLSDGAFRLTFGWGLALFVVGGVALVGAGVLHRTQLPAWRRQ